jgi:K+-transporting ATPase ATPase A chain
MTIIGWAQIALVFALVALCAYPLGLYIARVLSGERTLLSTVFGPAERGIYTLAGSTRSRAWAGKATRSRCWC